jgi:outer membrane protein
MNKIRYLMAAIICGLAPVCLADISIGVVDVNRVLQESIIGKAARNSIEAEAKKSQGKLAALKGEYDRARADLEKQGALLSGAALEERREKLVKRERELERAVQDAREELSRKNGVQMGKIMQQVDSVVKSIAQERKLAFVLERDVQGVVYADEKLDITKFVVTELDEKKLAL